MDLNINKITKETMSDIFERNNLTEYEKLLFAKSHFDELKQALSASQIVVGMLKAENDELKHELNSNRPYARKYFLKNELCKTLEKKMKQMKKDEQDLIIKIVNYETKQ